MIGDTERPTTLHGMFLVLFAVLGQINVWPSTAHIGHCFLVAHEVIAVEQCSLA